MKVTISRSYFDGGTLTNTETVELGPFHKITSNDGYLYGDDELILEWEKDTERDYGECARDYAIMWVTLHHKDIPKSLRGQHSPYLVDIEIT